MVWSMFELTLPIERVLQINDRSVSLMSISTFKEGIVILHRVVLSHCHSYTNTPNSDRTNRLVNCQN